MLCDQLLHASAFTMDCTPLNCKPKGNPFFLKLLLPFISVRTARKATHLKTTIQSPSIPPRDYSLRISTVRRLATEVSTQSKYAPPTMRSSLGLFLWKVLFAFLCPLYCFRDDTRLSKWQHEPFKRVCCSQLCLLKPSPSRIYT